MFGKNVNTNQSRPLFSAFSAFCKRCVSQLVVLTKPHQQHDLSIDFVLMGLAEFFNLLQLRLSQPGWQVAEFKPFQRVLIQEL